MNYEELESKYLGVKPKKRKYVKKTAVNVLWDGEIGDVKKTASYAFSEIEGNGKTTYVKKVSNIEKDKTSYLNYNGRICPFVGYLNEDIGYGIKKGHKVYKAIYEEKFVLDLFGTLFAYHQNSFITKVDFIKQPETGKIVSIDKPEPRKPNFNIEEWRNEPEPHFHENDPLNKKII